MVDITWLTQEAKTLHAIFVNLFYPLITFFLVLGVTLDYFKMPLGQIPSFGVLVGRAIIAILLLSSYTLVTNYLGEATDALAARVGDLNQIDHVVAKMGEKLETMSASWVSVKETITVALSFISFFGLYFSTYVAEGIFLFTWTLLYVFSPLLIALYILPATSAATKALYRSLFEVSCWKIVWSVLATLLWSMALSNLNKPGSDVNFVSVICLNLILASSLLLTPWVVHALAGAGLSGYTRTLGSVAVGAITVSPGAVIHAAKATTTSGLNAGARVQQNVQRRFFKEKSPALKK